VPSNQHSTEGKPGIPPSSRFSYCTNLVGVSLAVSSFPKRFDLCAKFIQHPFFSNHSAHIMELDSILQISFGITATLIAVLALWFARHTARGKSSLTSC
jgi:hypothetical protein